MNSKLLQSMLVIAAMGIGSSAYASSLTLNNPPGPALSPGDTVTLSDFITGTGTAFSDNWDFTLSKTSEVSDNIFNLCDKKLIGITAFTVNLYTDIGGVLTLVPGATGTHFSVSSLPNLGAGNYYDLIVSGTTKGTVGGSYGGTISVVPLPAAAWLLLSGLVGVGAMARRRKIDA